MIIYNVLIIDRYCDPIIHNFTDKGAAINFAIQNAKEFCKFPENLEVVLYAPNDDNGWLLFVETSCEGDYVRVTEGELNESD